MDADALRAWVYELEHRDFGDPQRLIAGFRQVDLSKAPVAIFHLAGTPLRIDTLIDFRTEVVLVTHISEVQRRLRSANT
jgi:mRNA-degrading endonuclease HigB of HigAB toxin-antitoxin module